jgi:hypothetical protein
MKLPWFRMINRSAKPFETCFDILQIIENLSAIRSPLYHRLLHAHARIPDYHPKCSRDTKRPTARNDAELMSSREIDRLLAECHVLPPCLGAAVNKLHLIRICSLPVHHTVYELLVPQETRGHSHQLPCSYRRPAVSPAIRNEGTTAITTPNAFNDGGKFL